MLPDSSMIRTVIKMRKFTKIICVVLALVVALSVTSCTLHKPYSYKTDDVDLPIGVYICYLYKAYGEAQTYAQQSDLYNAEDGTYDGSKSFLSIEITDDDGNTAVAEDWIKDKAAEYMNEAVAIYHLYEESDVKIDSKQLSENNKTLKKYWDNDHYEPYRYSDGTIMTDEDGQAYTYYVEAYKKTFEPYGVAFDSYFLVYVRIPMMSQALFDAEYAEDGPQPVTEEEMRKYYEENFTSYHYISAVLYTTETDEETEKTVNTSMSDEDIKKYTDAFDGYAAAINGGAAFSDQVTAYNEAFSSSATSIDKTLKIDADTEDKLQKEVLTLKEGEAKQVVIYQDKKNDDGETVEDKDSGIIYLIYKEPIADTTEAYFAQDNVKDSMLHTMKDDEFKKLLQDIADSLSIDKSSDIDDYEPSMFE